MRRYETVYILRPDLSEEGVKKINEKLAELVARRGGRVAVQKDLGLKLLAYRISRQAKGRYFQVEFEGGGEVLDEVERGLRLSEECLRFLTVRAERPAEGGAKP